MELPRFGGRLRVVDLPVHGRQGLDPAFDARRQPVHRRPAAAADTEKKAQADHQGPEPRAPQEHAHPCGRRRRIGLDGTQRAACDGAQALAEPLELALGRLLEEGGSPADVMGRYQRRSEEVDAMMVEAYVSGVSQRKMGDVTEALMGERVGRSTVSRVAKRLDEGVQTLRSAPIEGAHPYLYLDATFLDARWARKVENVSALVAYAVGPDGHRRLLGITLGPEESENSWSELLEQLLERGLSGVQLVIADEHAGLAAAVRRFLPEVRRQRCTVHLQRNVLAKVPHRLRKRVAREVAAVFRAPGLAESKKRLAEITARWHKELPEAVNVLERGFTAATQFYAFPEPHWARLRTTNSLERLHTEIKRRIRSAGAFPDRASALRLITAVALRTTAVWSERRYLDLTLLEPKEVAKAA